MIDNQQNSASSKADITELFDCILVINLSNRNDRRAEMEYELRKIGISLYDNSSEILVASKFTEAAGFDTVGARGCFDSHLRAMKLAVNRNAKNLLIFEDDCDFIVDIEHKISNVIGSLSIKNWSIFYGGHLSALDNENFGDDVTLISPNKALQGSHFVGISGTVLPLLIDYFEQMVARAPGSPLGGPMHVDGAYSWFRQAHPQLETWVACPQLGFQRPSRTDVHELRFFDRVPGMRELVGIARRFKRRIQR